MLFENKYLEKEIKNMDMDMFANSQMAIRDYLDKDGNNEFPHKTMVTVKQNSEVVHHGIESVMARIETNYSFVDIIWKKDDRNLGEKYYQGYTNEYKVMKYDGNFLIIFAEDKKGNKIEISID